MQFTQAAEILTFTTSPLSVPLFARQMFEGLGPGWAASILGFVSLVAIPVPFLFQR